MGKGWDGVRPLTRRPSRVGADPFSTTQSLAHTPIPTLSPSRGKGGRRVPAALPAAKPRCLTARSRKPAEAAPLRTPRKSAFSAVEYGLRPLTLAPDDPAGVEGGDLQLLGFAAPGPADQHRAQGVRR